MEEQNESEELVQASGGSQSASFFAIYKKGQGYWTRMGTALGAAILITVTALFAYEQAKAVNNNNIAIGITAGVVIGGILVCWLLMNKPRNVDFLIATDSEMKKVNWTSKGELFGSTRVVIFFMFLIALALFVIDVLAGLFFYYMGVLKINPFA